MAKSGHGHTPAAWTGVIIAFIGFCVTCVFIVAANPVGFWAGIALLAIAAIVGGVMKMVGLGTPKDTPEIKRMRDDAAAKVRARLEAQAG
ncbi:HGxxPAAW family protein [Streptomyces sp. NPDC048416]|uniref:HGxxPAAW family protein n=1 Tax=Streptomyces sp. NPDC048416 TaxID=3365546 RepID=UPI0037175953